jgi:hypothetical protein
MRHIRNISMWVAMVSPIFILLVTAIACLSYEKLQSIDDKLFKHLTNDELHTPRSMVISKAEFLLYQNMRDLQMKEIKDAVFEIKDNVKHHILNNVKEK